MTEPASTGDARPSPPVVITEVVERIGIITLNRPARRNALNGELIAALDVAVQEMAENDEVKVVVLTGAPGEGQHGGFCSGGDTKDGGTVASSDPSAPPQHPLAGDLARHDLQAAMLLHVMPKPTIAMIGGPAVGAGFSLAGACDLRFASDDAVFSSNFSANGLSGDYGGTFFWTRIIGTAHTRELYFMNEKLSAQQAFEWGMVNRVLPAAELADHTMAVARQMLRTPASLWALLKDNLNRAEDDADRRRYLFASESANMVKAMGDIAERMRLKAARPNK